MSKRLVEAVDPFQKALVEARKRYNIKLYNKLMTRCARFGELDKVARCVDILMLTVLWSFAIRQVQLALADLRTAVSYLKCIISCLAYAAQSVHGPGHRVCPSPLGPGPQRVHLLHPDQRIHPQRHTAHVRRPGHQQGG